MERIAVRNHSAVLHQEMAMADHGHKGTVTSKTRLFFSSQTLICVVVLVDDVEIAFEAFVGLGSMSACV